MWPHTPNSIIRTKPLLAQGGHSGCPWGTAESHQYTDSVATAFDPKLTADLRVPRERGTASNGAVSTFLCSRIHRAAHSEKQYPSGKMANATANDESGGIFVSPNMSA
jgi:5-methylcytosine-specific restriction endonuclease McrA